MAQLQQPVAHKRSAKAGWHRAARVTWIVTSWIWTTIIIAFLIQFVPAMILSKPDDLAKTQGYHAIQFLDPAQAPPPGFEIWKVAALGGILFFAAITLLAFLLKQLLRETGPENFDRILQALEQDIIPTQLDLLSTQLGKQFQQELERQNILINGLAHIHELLKKNLDATHLRNLQMTLTTLSNTQKEQARMLHNLYTDFQSSTIPQQIQHLSDLYEQEKNDHAATSTNLQRISTNLGELQDKLNAAIQTDKLGTTSHHGLSTNTEQTPSIHLLPPHPSEQADEIPEIDADDTAKLS